MESDMPSPAAQGLVSQRAALAPLWRIMHENLGVEGDEATFNSLMVSYESEDRFYHGPRHLVALFDATDGFFGREIDNLMAGKIAAMIFFHDGVMSFEYPPPQPSNEAASAALWRDYAAPRLPAEVVEEVAQAILTTQTHLWTGEGEEPLASRILNDVDMSILASSPEVYATYASNIWREWRAVGEDAYRAGRTAFLQALDPGSVFRTPEFSTPGDIAAIARNRDWEIDALSRHPNGPLILV